MKPKAKKALGWTAGIVLACGLVGAAIPSEPTEDPSFGGGREEVIEQTVTPSQTDNLFEEPSAEPQPDSSEAPGNEIEPSAEPEPSMSDEPSAEPEHSNEPEPSKEPEPIATPSASPSPSTTPVPSASPSQSPVSQQKYVASSESDKYHKPTCRWAKEIHADNLIYFDTVEQAKAAGYTACGTCRPK